MTTKPIVYNPLGIVPEEEVREQLAVVEKLAQQLEEKCDCATCRLLRTLASVDSRIDRVVLPRRDEEE